MNETTPTEETVKIARKIEVSFDISPCPDAKIRLHNMKVEVSFDVTLQENDDPKIVAQNALKACTDQLKASVERTDFDATELILNGDLEFAFHEEDYSSPSTTVRVNDTHFADANNIPERIDQITESIIDQFTSILVAKQQ